jgi:hypothetical protein
VRPRDLHDDRALEQLGLLGLQLLGGGDIVVGQVALEQVGDVFATIVEVRRCG